MALRQPEVNVYGCCMQCSKSIWLQAGNRTAAEAGAGPLHHDPLLNQGTKAVASTQDNVTQIKPASASRRKRYDV